MLSFGTIGILALAASLASAATTHRVNVGMNGLNTYDPPNTNAATGDIIEFHFFPQNHTVTEGNFRDPCNPIGGAFFSGFIATSDTNGSTTFTIVLRDTLPIFFYCSQANHCQSGMVGSINAPSSGNTLAAWRNAAASAQANTAPTRATGGEVRDGTSTTISPSSSRGLGTIATAPPIIGGAALMAIAALL